MTEKNKSASKTRSVFEKGSGIIDRAIQESIQAQESMETSAAGRASDGPIPEAAVVDTVKVEAVTLTLEKIAQAVAPETASPQEAPPQETTNATT